MARPKGIGRITTSITVSPEFFNLAKKYHLSFTEATRIGLALLFAERGIKEYDNKLNLFRKMQLYQTRCEEMGKELTKLKENGERKGING
jgi:hypothetical protein